MQPISSFHSRVGWVGAGAMLRFILLVSLPLGGCAGSQGFDRSTMYDALHPGIGTIAEQNVPAAEAGAPTASLPFRLALYFVQRDFPTPGNIRNAQWVSPDKDALMNGLALLRNEGIVADAFLLADPTIRGRDVQRIRRAAARYGADAVLIVEGVGAVDRYNNGYAAWYATVIGAYFAPGTVSEALFLISGGLWDARTERLYVTQTAEGRSKLVGSAVLLDDGAALAQAKKTALDEFGKRTADELRRLRATPPASDRSR